MRLLFAYIPKHALALLVVCSALFFLLAADVKHHGPISRMDRPISQALHDAGTANSILLQCGTQLGAELTVRFTWTLVVVLVAIRRWHHLPAFWLATALGGTINGRMQMYFDRPRPEFPDMEKLAYPGFPSGHAAGACLLFGFFLILAWTELRDWRARTLAVGVSGACILFVGYTRVALLAHHTTDVLGSFLWCTAWLLGCHYGSRAACHWSARQTQDWIAPLPGPLMATTVPK